MTIISLDILVFSVKVKTPLCHSLGGISILTKFLKLKQEIKWKGNLRLPSVRILQVNLWRNSTSSLAHGRLTTWHKDFTAVVYLKARRCLLLLSMLILSLSLCCSVLSPWPWFVSNWFYQIKTTDYTAIFAIYCNRSHWPWQSLQDTLLLLMAEI